MCEQEIKPRFINTTVHTRRHMQRAYQASMPLWRILLVTGLCILVVLIFAATLAISISSGGEIAMPVTSIIALIYVALMIVYVFFLRSWLAARRYEKVNGELYPGKTPQVTWHFYEDHVTAQSNLSETIEQVEYSGIIRVKETKTHFLLFRRMRLFYHLDKAGFEQGDKGEFAAFLQEKIPDAVFQLKK